MRDARTLLAAAAQLYDDPANGLQAAAHAAAWRGFTGGAAWMRRAMGHASRYAAEVSFQTKTSRSLRNPLDGPAA